jgi:hypothetical protein
MERFYGDDSEKDKEPIFGSGGGGGSDDNDDDDDEDFGDDDGETIAIIDQQNIIDVMQMDLAQTGLNQQLVAQAVEIARQSWLWWFKSTATRMAEIEAIYKRLLKLTEDEGEEDEEDEE